MIISCLKHLASSQARIIEDVVLIKSPVDLKEGLIRKLKKPILGRLVNIFSSNNMAMNCLYYLCSNNTALGTGALILKGVENVDAARLVGHNLKSFQKWDGVLNKIRF